MFKDRRNENRLIKRARYSINRILWRSDLSTIRISLALMAILWGLFAVVPGSNAFLFNYPSYSLMMKMMDQYLWAALFIFQGLVLISSLLFNIYNRVTLLLDAILGCFLWSTLSASYLATTWVSYSSVSSSLFLYIPPAHGSCILVTAMLSWWVLIRYGEVDKC